MRQIEPPLHNREQLEERAAWARNLLADPMFQQMCSEMEQSALAELRGIPLGELTAHGPHARVRVLNEVRTYLQNMVTDLKIADGRIARKV